MSDSKPQQGYRGRNGVDWDSELEYVKELDAKAGKPQRFATEPLCAHEGFTGKTADCPYHGLQQQNKPQHNGTTDDRKGAEMSKHKDENAVVFTGYVFDCPAQSVVEESCICKPSWGHRSLRVDVPRPSAPDPAAELARETADSIIGETANCELSPQQLADFITGKIAALLRERMGERWIPVSERLPHTHTVLGYIVAGYCGEQSPFIDTVCYFPAHDPQRVYGGDLPQGEWRLNGYDEKPDRGVVTVTHWRPLPAPPAEGVK